MADRKIRISARLWMNGLDPRAAATKQGAGIVGVPSWWASPERRPSSTRLVERWRGHPMRSAGDATQIDKQNHNSILKPCQITVVYQAPDRSRIIAS
jgi:hypothetical protein